MKNFLLIFILLAPLLSMAQSDSYIVNLNGDTIYTEWRINETMTLGKVKQKIVYKDESNETIKLDPNGLQKLHGSTKIPERTKKIEKLFDANNPDYYDPKGFAFKIETRYRDEFMGDFDVVRVSDLNKKDKLALLVLVENKDIKLYFKAVKKASQQAGSGLGMSNQAADEIVSHRYFFNDGKKISALDKKNCKVLLSRAFEGCDEAIQVLNSQNKPLEYVLDFVEVYKACLENKEHKK